MNVRGLVRRPRYEAALFDCDGLLVETGELWRFAWAAASGQPIDDELLAELAGASVRTGASRLGDLLGVEISPAAVEAGLLEALERNGRPAPEVGIVELVERVQSMRRIAIVSNGPRAFIEELLTPELLGLFEGRIFTSTDVSARTGADADKPKPGVYAYACRELAVSPSSSVAFEDSAAGARSAVAAGLALVVINQRVQPATRAHLFVGQATDPAIDVFLARGPSGRGEARAAALVIDDANIELLYARAFDALSTFLDWRYKVMSLTVLLVGGVLAIAGWLFSHVHTHERWTLALPLAAGALFCLALSRLDKRNEIIVNESYRVGIELERRLGATHGSVMAALPASRPFWTYSRTINWLLWLLTVALGGAAICAVIFGR